MRVLLLVVAALSGSPALMGQQHCNESVVRPASSLVEDLFGQRLDASANLMVVGAPCRDEGADDAGAAYVFGRQGGRWGEVAKLTSGDPVTDQRFGQSVATNGTTIMVQTWQHSPAGAPPGNGSTVDVFEERNGNWILLQSLYDPNNQLNGPDNFGHDIHLEVDRAFIARPGGLHVYAKQGASWVETQAIDRTDLPPPFTQLGSAQFAHRVAVVGNQMAIAHRFTAPAHIFEHDGSAWRATAEIDSTPPGQFTDAKVAFNGHSVFVSQELAGLQTGAVWVFRHDGVSWQNTQLLTASDASTFFRFGSALEAADDTLAVGSFAWDSGAFVNTGAVYAFEWDGVTWTERARVELGAPATGASLGTDVDVAGDRIIGGARGAGIGSYLGSVSEFTLRSSIGTPYGSSLPNSTGVAGVLVADGSSVLEHNCLMLATTGIPPGQFGYFLMSLTQGYVELFGGSQGNLHLGLPIVRFSGDILIADPQGEVTFSPDLTALPQATVFLPGDTWNFQMWFRDNNPGPTSNTTNGLAITFETTDDPAVQFPATLLSQTEATIQIAVAVTLSQPTEHDMLVPYTTGGTATYNADWRVEEPNPIVIPAGDTTYEMTLLVAEDTAQEGDETGIVTLGAPTGGVLGTAPEFTLTIVDDD